MPVAGNDELAPSRDLRVGSATVPSDVSAGGIPSIAASEKLAVVSGGGGAAATRAVPVAAGSPSQASGARSVTLPGTGERDGYAADTAATSGGGASPSTSGATPPSSPQTITAPQDDAPVAPAVTPGQSAAQAEALAAAATAVANPDHTPAVPVGGAAAAM
jgi:hypothetical protein